MDDAAVTKTSPSDSSMALALRLGAEFRNRRNGSTVWEHPGFEASQPVAGFKSQDAAAVDFLRAVSAQIAAVRRIDSTDQNVPKFN